MSAEFAVRPFAPADAGDCAAIFAAANRSLRGAAGDFAAETAEEELLVAAAPGGAILGFAALYRPHRFVHHLYVAAPARRRGVGAALLRAAVALAGGEAELKCLADNDAALAFYRALGWAETGERGADEGGPWIRLKALSAARGRLDLTITPLAGAFARLEPLAPAHREELRALVADPTLWRWWPWDMADWDAAFDAQTAAHATGRRMVHLVRDAEGRAVGQTCYLAPAPEHARVEIGGTWYASTAQGGRVNPAAKLLMLAHAFACGAQRVEFKTDARNARSRAALLKLGATFEGVHRRHMRLPDGSWRDTAWFSVLAPEWPRVRAGLEARLGL